MNLHGLYYRKQTNRKIQTRNRGSYHYTLILWSVRFSILIQRRVDGVFLQHSKLGYLRGEITLLVVIVMSLSTFVVFRGLRDGMFRSHFYNSPVVT